MSNSLNKLLQLSESEAKSSKFMQMFSSHPETQKRADRVKEKADEYVKSKQ
jgi:putative metalloprotease